MMAEEHDPVSRREIASWCLYDFANSAFTTLIVTFIFSQFFTRVIAEDNISGTVIWSRAVNISAIIIALTMPVIGAIADFSRRKKLFLLLATLQTLIFTTLLFFIGPGDAFIAAILFVIANVGYEAASAFYNAFLPELSTEKNSGRISGYGWALGYVGGLLALAIALGMVDGWLPTEDYLNVRATVLLVVVWFALFSIPAFLFLKERGHSRPAEPGTYVIEGFRRVGETFRHLRRYGEAAKMLLARLIYNDGLVTIFSFGAIYATAVFGMDTADAIKLGITLNVAAAIGAFGLGFVNDWIGGKWTVVITLVVLSIAALVGATVESRTGFWVAAIGIGLMVGPNQAASRSLLGVMTPKEKHGEFFGFFAFSGKLASVAGPFVYGTVVAATEDHRTAMASIVVFFVIGLVLLLLVDEKAGIAAVQDERMAVQETGNPSEPLRGMIDSTDNSQRTARRTRSFTESVIREMTRVANQHDAINLSQGFPNFAAPEVLKQAACEAIRGDINQYAVTWGSPRIRWALTQKYARYYGMEVDPDREITVTCGATEAMAATMLALVNPGDEVVVLEPFYENYGPDAILCGARPVFVKTAEDGSLDFDRLAPAFSARTRAIILNTPNNPTGHVFTRRELQAVADLCQTHDALAFTDEIYEHILYEGEHVPLATLEGMRDRTVTISGFSKTFSITGWRVGTIVAPPDLTDAIRKTHDFLTVGAPAPLQDACAAGLERLDEGYYRKLAEDYRQRRDVLYDALADAGFSCRPPAGAYYIMADFSNLSDMPDDEFAVWLTREHGVATVPGSSFFSDPEDGRYLVRFAFCKTIDMLEQAGERLRGVQ